MTALLISILLASLPPMHFFHMGVESGLSRVAINGLYQDENGTLWAGTKEGTKFFDGTSFTPVPLAAQNNWITSNRTPTVCGDCDGSVFITSNYQVIRYDLHNETTEVIFTQDNTSLPPDISIHCGPSGLWIGCADSIYKWRRGEIQQVKCFGPGTIVSAILEYGEVLYAGTKRNGLMACASTGDVCTSILPCDEVMYLFADTGGRIWCGTLDQGVFCIDGDLISHFDKDSTPALGDNYIRSIAEDPYGRIWLGTSDGVDIIDASSDSAIHCGTLWNGSPALSEQSIWSLFCDRSGVMWIGSYFGGLDYCTFDEDCFSFDNLGFDGNKDRPIISDIDFDKEGCIWIATEGKGIIRLRDGDCETMDELPFSKYNIKDIFFDADSSLMWVCTHMGGVWKYNTKDGSARHYAINERDISARSESTICAALYRKQLLVGTLQGVWLIDPASGRVDPVSEVNKYIYEADDIIVSRDSSSIWIAGNSLCRYIPANGVVEDYSTSLEGLSGGTPVTSTSILECLDGTIYVGTAGFGLLKYNRASDAFERVETRDSGFLSGYIGSLYYTEDGHILLGTNKGLCRYNPVTGFVDNFDSENGFPLLSMIPGCICRNGDRLFLGGINGIVESSESRLGQYNPPCRISLDNLIINDILIRPCDGSGILKQSLRYTDRLVLSHEKNKLSFTVTSDCPSMSTQVRYMYKLEGVEKEWRTQSLAQPIRYSNLSHGKYVLHVRNVNPDNDGQIELHLSIKPPFWLSWQAWLLYFVFSLTIATFVIYFFATKFRLTESLALERQKMRFFANMSHELRTPLTIVMGGLELFRDKQGLSENQKRELGSIHAKAGEMVDIISDQMDLLKMEENALHLNADDGDIVAFAEDAVNSFRVLSVQKGIALQFSSELPSCRISFDRKQMKKVFNNLLSNAFKYTTGNNGRISVSLMAPKDEMLRIIFKDNGIGIAEKAKGRIFERFFQGSNAVNSDPSVTGTGIGLYMVSNIVGLHGGKVSVDSKEGEGSTFTVYLPVSADIPPAVSVLPKSPASEPDYSIEKDPQKVSGKLLLVEDDAAIRQMLKEIFAGEFEVYEAENGSDGLEIAGEACPDLIISDIMMPVMGGEEFCRRIKSDFSTCHIPVILLTALADVQNNIKGFDCGADDYITKPFNSDLLVARCTAILRNRALLQKRYSADVGAAPKMLSSNKADIEFMDKLVRVIEDNLLERQVSVPFLCEQMAMGHTKLFNKIKGLTGASPQEFIQSIRLKYAARLLREDASMNVSDVAYQLGYSSLNYFGKCFRNAFGQSPSAYRRNTTF